MRIPKRSITKDRQTPKTMSFTWTHELNVMKAICPRELRSHCVDKKCTFQHLGQMKVGLGHALATVDLIQSFLTAQMKAQSEKDFVRAKLDIYSGKTADFESIISKLISCLFPSPSRAPFSRPLPEPSNP